MVPFRVPTLSGSPSGLRSSEGFATKIPCPKGSHSSFLLGKLLKKVMERLGRDPLVRKNG